ncbi:MAG: 2-phosphosulfolactate phosphatase family protein [Candidatus Zixiibacteriota bacterium]
MLVGVSLAPTLLREELGRFGDTLITYVMVDVLRASTTLCTAIANGAAGIESFADIEQARAAKQVLGDSVLLCGERGGRKIEGFDLGNSPTEYTSAKVAGKRLVFASTNGSVALSAAPPKSEVLVGGLVNVTAVARRIAELERTTIIACAGKLGRVSLEDIVGAGAIFAKLWELVPDLQPVGDSAQVVQIAWDRYKSDPAMALWQSEHGRYLIEVGFGSDLSLCADIDSVPVLPRKQGDVLINDERITDR